jgi:uncharacterized protein (DUF433 family)
MEFNTLTNEEIVEEINNRLEELFEFIKDANFQITREDIRLYLQYAKEYINEIKKSLLEE